MATTNINIPIENAVTDGSLNPVTSNAVFDGLATKASATGLSTHIADTANPHAVTKSQVGLANADNTSDANKPVSTATQTALDLKLSKHDGVTYDTNAIQTVTAAEYAAIVTKDASTLYFIV